MNIQRLQTHRFLRDVVESFSRAGFLTAREMKTWAALELR
jgi:hypothetical protein